MRRLCIYLTFDKENIVDQYIIYMLQELRACSEYILVVSNSKCIKRGREVLEHIADKVICRENIGFDAGGFKEALCRYIGWDKVYEYDELVLVNDSLFGPFRSMESIFSDMDNHKVDFWGLAAHGEHSKEIPEHIQAYFLVIRSKLLHSISFKEYWERMPFYSTFSQVVYQHETKFTSYFESLGYTYGVLADTKINDSTVSPLNNYMQYAMISYELIKKRNFPFLKKQQIAYNTLSLQTQENLYQSIDYIDKNTEYNVDLIWENIIRTLNIADLQRSLHFQYIISAEKREFVIKRKIAIVIFADYKEAVEYVLEYLSCLKQNASYIIQIISKSHEILEIYRKNRVEDMEFLLKEDCNWTELEKYEYVCVLHDVDITSDTMPSCTGKSYFYNIWENLFKNESHILEIIRKFEEEKCLGFLAPPQPNFAQYFGELGDGWDKKYEIIEEILKKLKLNCQISEDKPPFRVTNDFWIRGNILKCLRNIEIDQYPYLPYLWSYFAQHMGYYSGIVESVDYASMNEVNMLFYLKQMAIQVRSQYEDFHSFDEMKEKVLLGALKIFNEKHSQVLIYGAGYYARKYMGLLSNVEACIVSDGQKKDNYLNEIPIRYLSEIRDLCKYGIVLCLDLKNQKQVIPVLEQYGVKDYFCISC